MMPSRLAWQNGRGFQFEEISFEGVSPDRLATASRPSDSGSRRASRSGQSCSRPATLFATGLFDAIEADATRQGDGVNLVFRGKARDFIGIVTVDGAKGATINAQLAAASRLNPERVLADAARTRIVRMRQTLADNGFNEPVITYTLTRHQDEQLVDIAFEVVSGVQTRVGSVAVSGDSGMTARSVPA